MVHIGSSEAHKYHLNYSAGNYQSQDVFVLQGKDVVTWKAQFVEVHIGIFVGSSVCLP